MSEFNKGFTCAESEFNKGFTCAEDGGVCPPCASEDFMAGYNSSYQQQANLDDQTGEVNERVGKEIKQGAGASECAKKPKKHFW